MDGSSSSAGCDQTTSSSGTSQSKGKEPAYKSEPTTPPRISFGIEIEFLVAERREKEDPDKDIAHLLPPVYMRGTTKDKIWKLLETKGIPMLHGMPSSGWDVGDDGSVYEDPCDYSWRNIELRSPASYATDEAFDMVRLVVHHITSNFRCRVNYTCGLHVHVGNGLERIEARAVRNFAALMWAAEPILSTLHPPERGFNAYSRSYRRLDEISLAQGRTAEQVRRRIVQDHNEPRTMQMRYNARERELGETPEPEAFDFWGPASCRPWDGNDTDWEADGFKPFKRPKKGGHLGTLVQGDTLMNPGRLTIKAGPPEIPSRFAEEGGSSTVSDEDGPDVGDSSPASSVSGVDGGLPRTRQPPFPRRGRRSNNYRPVDILLEGIRGRLESVDEEGIEVRRPEREDSWSGVKELLSCDVGSHQVGNLMTVPHRFRSASLNFAYYVDTGVTWAVRLPASELDESGRRQRAERRQVSPFDGLRDYTRVTIESRECAGSLDGDWIVAWARILCGLLEFARDADPAEFMRVVGLCVEACEGADEEKAYDVVDLLDDTGLWAEARFCEGRLRRGEEAWFECMIREDLYPKQERVQEEELEVDYSSLPWEAVAARKCLLDKAEQGLVATMPDGGESRGSSANSSWPMADPPGRGENEEDWRQLRAPESVLNDLGTSQLDWGNPRRE